MDKNTAEVLAHAAVAALAPLAKPVLTLPAWELRRPAKKVLVFGDELRKLADQLVDTMYHEGGVGIAANQIGDHRAVVVVELDGQPTVLVNPLIVEYSDDTFVSRESCLSVPGLSVAVNRFTWVRFAFDDLDGNECEGQASDFNAAVVQHEADHCAGLLLTDHIAHRNGKATRSGSWM